MTEVRKDSITLVQGGKLAAVQVMAYTFVYPFHDNSFRA